jgi:hypothetical protein
MREEKVMERDSVSLQVVHRNTQKHYDQRAPQEIKQKNSENPTARRQKVY